MITQAVILCGGLGTRLKPITNKIPKPMVKLNKKPFILYIIEQLKKQRIKKVLLLTGYLGEKIQTYFGDGSKFGIKISYSNGPVKWDTGRRIWEARDLFDKEFLLLYSDNFTTINLKKNFNFFKKKKSAISLTLSSKNPGNIFLNQDNIVEKFHTKRLKKFSYVEIGYMMVNKKKILKEFDITNCSFNYIIKKLSLKHKVSALIQDDKYYSISDRDRMKLAEKYLRPKKILLIDRDGVINSKSKKGRYLNYWNDFSFIKRTVKSMKKLSSSGFSFVVITNQAGVARGFTKIDELKNIHKNMINYLYKKGIKILKVYTCTHGWEDNCNCRKPKPGMLFRASNEFLFRLDQTFFIGDDDRDMQAAKFAGCEGILWRDKKKFLDISEIINDKKYLQKIN